MTLSSFTLAKLTQDGSWVHLSLDGKPLYLQDEPDNEGEPKFEIGLIESDRPVRLRLRSVAHPDVTKALKEMSRAEEVRKWSEDRASRETINSVIEANSADIEAKVKTLIGAAVEEWENISIDEASPRLAVDSDRAYVLRLVGINTPFWLQIYKALMGQKLNLKNAASD